MDLLTTWPAKWLMILFCVLFFCCYFALLARQRMKDRMTASISPIRSFVRSFVRSFIHSLIHSCTIRLSFAAALNSAMSLWYNAGCEGLADSFFVHINFSSYFLPSFRVFTRRLHYARTDFLWRRPTFSVITDNPHHGRTAGDACRSDSSFHVSG